jgi:hypothetical protein
VEASGKRGHLYHHNKASKENPDETDDTFEQNKDDCLRFIYRLLYFLCRKPWRFIILPSNDPIYNKALIWDAGMTWNEGRTKTHKDTDNFVTW